MADEFEDRKAKASAWFRSLRNEIVDGLDWQGPVYLISAIARDGVDELCNDIMNFLEQDESV